MAPATEAQIAFIQTLLEGREVHEELAQATCAMMEGEGFTKALASQVITSLKAIPRRAREDAPTPVEPGVYEVDGEVFVVKPNRQGTRVYAKRLVTINGTRLTEADSHEHFDFEYAPGAIRRIRPEHRMDLERAKELTIRYGRCLNCGRRLKDATSVERGIGPVCIKAFR
jgi:hypothetical protein